MTVNIYSVGKVNATKEVLNAMACDFSTLANFYEDKNPAMSEIYWKRFLAYMKNWKK